MSYLPITSRQVQWLKANGFVNTDNDLIVPHTWKPNNYAIMDANGNYHQMVEINRKNWDATNEFASATIHDAFMVGGVQKRLFIGKGHLVDDGNGHPVTWLNKLPMVSKTFDQELAACASLNNGLTITGWHQMTMIEWALMMQIIKSSDVTVRGNNNWGQDINEKSVTFRLGTAAAFNDHASDGRSYAGSGGNKTSHNGAPDGIFDLTGNVWQRIAGCKIVNGEIQISNANNMADAIVDQSEASTQYMAILEDGTLVAPGTANTLKFSVNGNITKEAPGATSASKAFDSIGCESDVSAISPGVAMLKKYGLYPYTSGMGGTFWYNTAGGFIPLRGAGWYYTTSAAVPALICNYTRSNANWHIGFRAAFVGSM